MIGSWMRRARRVRAAWWVLFCGMLTLPAGGALAQTTPLLRVWNEAPIVQPGDTLVVAIRLDGPPVAHLFGVGLEVLYDTTALVVEGVVRGPLFDGFTFDGPSPQGTMFMEETTAGTERTLHLGLTLYRGAADPVASAAGTVLQVAFVVRASAVPGLYPLRVRAAEVWTLDPVTDEAGLVQPAMDDDAVLVAMDRRARRLRLEAGDPPAVVLPALGGLRLDADPLAAAAELMVTRVYRAPAGTPLPEAYDRLALPGFWQLEPTQGTVPAAGVCIPLEGVLDWVGRPSALVLVQRADAASPWEPRAVRFEPSAAAPERLCADGLVPAGELAVAGGSRATAAEGLARSGPAFTLTPLYPQPARQTVSTQLTVAVPQTVRVDLYDLRGRHVARVYDGYLPAGQPLRLTVPVRRWPAGLYLLRIVGTTFQATRPLAIVR